MDFKIEDQSTVKKEIKIEIPQADVTRQLDKAFKELGKTAKVKGFRPGKAPRNVLERLYGKDVRHDVAAQLIQESMLEVLQSAELEPVGSPVVDPPELKAGEGYGYTATIEVRPTLENFKIDDLKLKKTLYHATEEEIETQIKMLRQNLARMVPLETERPAAEGDFVIIDYEGLKGGKPFTETQHTANFSMKLGDGMIHKDLDAQIVGMRPKEEKEIVVTFPADHHNDKLAGLEIAFQVTLHEIREQQLPEIDDEMAKRLGKFETLAELRQKIADNLEKGYTKRSEQELNEQIFKALIDQQDFEVPDAMVAYELESIINEAQQTFAYHNTSMEELGLTQEALEAKYRDTAIKQVKRHLILGKIIAQEAMELSDEDLQQGYREMAESFNQPVETIQKFYAAHPDRVDVFKHALLEKQAIQLIIEKSSIEEVKPELEKPAEKQAAE
jgi:trigger factor